MLVTFRFFDVKNNSVTEFCKTPCYKEVERTQSIACFLLRIDNSFPSTNFSCVSLIYLCNFNTLQYNVLQGMLLLIIFTAQWKPMCSSVLHCKGQAIGGRKISCIVHSNIQEKSSSAMTKTTTTAVLATKLKGPHPHTEVQKNKNLYVAVWC